MKSNQGLAFVTVLAMLTANSFAAEKELVTVTISPAVQEQLQKGSPDERKKIATSINTGNRFIVHHFDGSAYARNDVQETKRWVKNIRPLVNKDDADWYKYGGIYNVSSPSFEINGKKAREIVVCPKTELISINTLADHIELNYRTKIIGLWKTNSGQFTEGDILLDTKEEFEEVLINLDENNKVNKVVSKFAVLVSLPQEGIDLFNSYIKYPSLIEIPPQSSLNAEQEKFRRYIKLIKDEEAITCNEPVNLSN